MEENKEILMSEQEAFQTLEFAQMMFNKSPIYQGGVYTPDLLNSTLKQINVNTLEPTEYNLKKALGNPNENEDNLVAYSEWYSVNNMMYKRTSEYLANMLSFDLRVECTNAKGKDYRSKEYKEDLDRIYKFIDRLNPKREFKKIVKNMLRQETVFTVFRDDTSSGYAIQQLPGKYCQITGHTNNTMLFDFDMGYFLNPSTSLDLYPNIFKEYYYDAFTDKNLGDYIPSNPLNRRDGSFVFWHQTSPLEGFYVFKFSPEIFTKIPYLAPLMPDVQNTGVVRKLQMNKNLASARALILGEIGFLDETKSGQKADQFNITPTTLATFLQLVKSALEDVWNIGGVPLKEIEKYQYDDANKEMYQNQLKTTSGQSVSMSRVIYSDDKMSQIEAEITLNTDANLMKSLYVQFEDFLNLYANMKTRKYNFKFHFEGIEYPMDREQRLERAMKMAEVGVVVPQLFSAALGLEPQEFDRTMEQAKETGFSDKLVQMISIHTQSGTKDSGRPRKSRTVKGRGDYDE